MNDYLAKPIVPQALAEALEQWLPSNSDKEGEQKENDGEKSVSPEASQDLINPCVFDRAGLIERLMDDAELKSCSEFGAEIIKHMG